MSQELQKFSKAVKTSNQKGAVKNKLQLKHFIQIDPLAKYFLTEMDVQGQFLSKADREMKKGIFVVNDQWSTMLGQLWLLIFLILEQCISLIFMKCFLTFMNDLLSFLSLGEKDLSTKLVFRVWNRSLVVYFVCFSPIICKETSLDEILSLKLDWFGFCSFMLQEQQY